MLSEESNKKESDYPGKKEIIFFLLTMGIRAKPLLVVIFNLKDNPVGRGIISPVLVGSWPDREMGG